MPKAYSLDLGERVVRFVEAGRSRHAAAAHFQVAVSFVVNLMKSDEGLHRERAARAQAERGPSPC